MSSLKAQPLVEVGNNAGFEFSAGRHSKVSEEHLLKKKQKAKKKTQNTEMEKLRHDISVKRLSG